jgi:hypothetical protein
MPKFEIKWCLIISLREHFNSSRWDFVFLRISNHTLNLSKQFLALNNGLTNRIWVENKVSFYNLNQYGNDK